MSGIYTGTPFIGTYTYATLPSASTVGAGAMARASDLGANGTMVISNGTRWLNLNGAAMLKGMGAAVSGIANSETIINQTLLPVNAWQVNDTIRIWIGVAKSGTTDSLACRIRVGTAGTTGDTAIYASSGANLISTTQQSGGFIFDFKLASATSAQRTGSGAITTAGSYTAATTTAAAAAVTITDASANALYVSVSILSSGTTDTVTAQSCQIQLMTP